MKTIMKQRSVLEFHILSGEASREVLSRGGDQRRVMSSQLWTRDEEVAIAVETSSVSLSSEVPDRIVYGESYGHYLLGSGWHPACGLFERGQSADCDRFTQLLRKLKSDIRNKRPDIDIKDITIRHNSRIHTSLGHGG